MKFLVDNQLPPALARLIQAELGSEAMHVCEIGLREAADAEVWKHASAADLILISKDEDFTSMALQTKRAGLLWVRRKRLERVSNWQPRNYRHYLWIVADPELPGGGKLAVRGTRLPRLADS